MPTKNTTYHYTWEEIILLIERKENKKVTKIISAGNDGVHCNMEDIKFDNEVKP